MNVVIRELILHPGYSSEDLIAAAAGRLRCGKEQITLRKILRRSLDARAIRTTPSYSINAEFSLDFTPDFANLLKVDQAVEELALVVAPASLSQRPVVIGAGPAGLFAALILARAGVKPLLIEQGKPVAERGKDVGLFWGQGLLNPQSNVLCGEGGAGTFSDGKLTSRSKDLVRKNFVFNTFIECGAPDSILYDSQAHLGSDRLGAIVTRLRETIISLGGEFRFNCCLNDLTVTDGRLQSLKLGEESFSASQCILATGHSARGLYRMLHEKGVALHAKGFAAGVRLELPQTIVNRARLGKFANNPHLETSSFMLTDQGRCHSFCMCPGGRVIACADEAGKLCTNGMSLSKRAGTLGNAAFLVPLPEFSDPFAGLDYLDKIEQAAFLAGGGTYSLPVTTLADFPRAPLKGLPFHSCGRIKPADFREILPDELCLQLEESMKRMLKQLPGAKQAVIYAAETRSTAPLQITRDDNMQSVNVQGLYPAGEGAGYAGGIISSAIDGVKAAQALLGQLLPE